MPEGRQHSGDCLRYKTLEYQSVHLLRIPAIHGAKTTKNQTPLAHLAQ